MDDFFYIIKDKRNGMLYAGSKCGKSSDLPKRITNPNTFMTTEGYQTSSSTIHKIIQEFGIDCFEVVKLKIMENAFEYETRFLKKVDARNNNRFYNTHNNEGALNNSGKKWYNDGVVSAMFIAGEQPKGWTVGSLGTKAKGKKYYTNGIESKMFIEGKQPNGWFRGNHNSKNSIKNPFFGKSYNKGMKTYTNLQTGKKSYFKDGEQPDGWELGVKSDKFINGRKEYMKTNNPMTGTFGLRMYNNGIEMKRFYEDQQPLGWIRGMIKNGS